MGKVKYFCDKYEEKQKHLLDLEHSPIEL